MPTLEVIRLSFPGGLHVGTNSVTLEASGVCIPSDTLFAALVDVYRRSGGNPDDWVQLFPRAQLVQADANRDKDHWQHTDAAAPFLLTSAFPYAGDVYFFPKPASWGQLFAPELLKERRKELDRISYVSLGILRLILQGERLDDWLFPADPNQEPDKGAALQGNTFWLTAEECEQLPHRMLFDRRCKRKKLLRILRRQQIFSEVRVPRVTVSRITSASEIFHAGRVSFTPDCGLWLGIQWHKPDARLGQTTLREMLEHLLSLLGDDGLGGERTAGYGAFRWQRAPEPLQLPDPAPGAPALLLSRYHPRARELPDVLTRAQAYALTAVGGWLRTWDAAAQRRRRLWLVREGSIVRAVDQMPWGDVVDVRPVYRGSGTVGVEHPVWRYGLALAVGMQEARP
ncbi:MAG: type III-A CRISPR-associated RAMP protein Csm4 [Anaerolineae bacterium]|nr:type III-A CRISPR-associated RAMP protein Csm4 [Anaerolineae bacterium]MDW8070874.1 type III-A CRISPR-associated RAMP protein Csm4 [Anaerolineae bacterium]